jgi:uncharacterized coiled-coil DUF342 family protein
MSVMLERWNDDKMDSLAAKVDGLGVRMEKGFERIDSELSEQRKELREQRKELREQGKELNARLDGMQRTMIQAAFTLSAAFIAGFAALIAT